MSKQEKKYTLCGFCQKPIHVNDWGGVNKEHGFFHRLCYLENKTDKQLESETKESLQEWLESQRELTPEEAKALDEFSKRTGSKKPKRKRF
jgi:hypothetical protein